LFREKLAKKKQSRKENPQKLVQIRRLLAKNIENTHFKRKRKTQNKKKRHSNK